MTDDKPHASLAGEAIELTISFLREMARRHPEVSQSSDVEAFIERELLPAMEMADNDRKSCGGLLTLLANEKRKVESLRSAEQRSQAEIEALVEEAYTAEAQGWNIKDGIRAVLRRELMRSHVALSEDSIRRFCMRWTGTQDSPMERDLRSMLSATGSAEWAEDARPWEMRDGDVTFLWMDDGIEVVAISHGKRWRTVLPLPVRRTESRNSQGGEHG